MLVKKEKYYTKETQLTHFKVSSNRYIVEQRKRISYWLLWIIPIFANDTVLRRDVVYK
jgi:hypothetical protein